MPVRQGAIDPSSGGPAILFVHPSDEAYGADRILLGLIDGLMQRGYRAAVLLSDDTEPGWLTGKLTARGVPVSRVPLAPARRRYLGPLNLWSYLSSLRRARRAVRRAAFSQSASILHVNTSALLVAAIVGRPRGVRLVWHIHEIVRRPRLLALVFRVAPLTADRAVVVSDAVRRFLLPDLLSGITALRRRVVTIYNGLPAEGRSDATPGDDAITVAFVGRLNRWKGYEVFVAAAARVATACPNVRFLVAGDAPIGEEWRVDDLRDRIRDAKLAGRVDYLGRVESGAAVIAAVDILVVPSTWPDPFPTVVLEAMRAGRAIVAAAHGGVPEMMVANETGLLVPPGDVSATAAAIIRLAEDRALSKRLGDAAAERFQERFTEDRFVDSFDHLYRSLLP